MSELLYEQQTYAIRGAIFDVYREMGSGFLEAVYRECLEKEFEQRGIPYVAKANCTSRIKVSLSFRSTNQILPAMLPSFSR